MTVKKRKRTSMSGKTAHPYEMKKVVNDNTPISKRSAISEVF